jgi:hypothetical protein
VTVACVGIMWHWLRLVSRGSVLRWHPLAVCCTSNGLEEDDGPPGSNPVGGVIFYTRSDRLWVPPSPLYNGYRLPFPGLEQPGRGVSPPFSSAGGKEKVPLRAFVASVRANFTLVL